MDLTHCDQASIDYILSTTRTVRRRLELDRPVPDEVLLDCLRLAVQAPSGGDRQPWRFVVVRDQERRAAIGALFRSRGEAYLRERRTGDRAPRDEVRLHRSVRHLLDTIDRVPVLVIPCLLGRPPAGVGAAAFYGSIYPAVWSFMLALRSRGLGAAWTTFHLHHEREAASILDIPHDEVTQTALLPVAYTVGSSFAAARRTPAEHVTYVDRWGHPASPSATTTRDG
ncbi:nitroreductase family protein [Egicoccus halophilus]|uniref:Oxidoreductase n=1 Tax=Egicoccus halophilus TaxID=1670830 RepID=A0A8J3EUN3_9ACTN|nr:nitroreductase family protein [Egicoccus halophilus]GGI07540.1 oxidoreductase [Egicoccus halophilus]